MTRHWLSAILLPVFLLNVSCNMSGYHDLGEPVNHFGQFGSGAFSFIRTHPTAEHMTVELFTISSTDDPYGSCAWLTIDEDSQAVNVRLKTGTYKRSGDRIEIDFYMHYINEYSETSKPSRTPGAVQHPLPKNQPEQYSWHYDASEDILYLGYRAFKDIRPIFDTILSQPTSDRGGRFMKLVLLYTMSTHCRIDGFGGAGMLQYVSKQTLFYGLLSGSMQFSVDGFKKITSRFNYQEHGDIAGMTLDGEMKNISDMNGNGEMRGVVDLTVSGRSGNWRGCIDYDHIRVTHTVPSGGYYILTIEDQAYEVDYRCGNPGHFDFSDILDPDPSNW